MRAESGRSPGHRRSRLAAMPTVSISEPALGKLAALAVGAASPRNAVVLLRNLRDRRREEPWSGYLSNRNADEAELAAAIDRAIAWIAHSQDRLGSGGIACYEFAGWTSGYPEVTGYIIPTFWDAA